MKTSTLDIISSKNWVPDPGRIAIVFISLISWKYSFVLTIFVLSFDSTIALSLLFDVLVIFP